jgi:AraC-like DNA-binding protein
MNIFLLSLVDKSIEGAMIRFSTLPVKSSLFNANHLEKLANSTKKILDSYISFFHCVSIVPKKYLYDEEKIVKKFDLSSHERNASDELERKLLELLPLELQSHIIPVNIHLKQSGDLFIYNGIGILDSTTPSVTFFLYKMSIKEASIEYTRTSLRYLDEMLKGENSAEIKSLRIFVRHFGVNYNQFQKDCKEYFGDTFHQFINKMKMLGALEDQIFTNYSCKEIAYRNGFKAYNNMHFLFRKKYNFPFELIPRLLAEI